MNKILQARAHEACEICEATTDALIAYNVPPKSEDDAEYQVALCAACHEAISSKNYTDPTRFTNLVSTIWSEIPAVKVLSYKVLGELRDQSWATEAMENAYLTEEEQAWAMAEEEALANAVVHKDAYGVVLAAGDSVILTENLNVKGANFIAPKGTKVPKIRLVPDNAEQIEGKINGDTIVILTKFVRKSV